MLAVLFICTAGASASAQVDIRVNVPVPNIRFDVRPPLVEVHPGIQVVENYDEEVFFTAGWYWVRREGAWFRARDGRDARWTQADAREVPVALIRIQPGRYIRWRPETPRPPPGQPVHAASAPVAHAAPPPPALRPNPPPPASTGQQVLRAKELRAGRIRARVIYAKEVTADDGTVGRVFQGETEEWERGRNDAKVDVPEIVADVIYAKEIKAGFIEATEIHAKKVKIGRK